MPQSFSNDSFLSEGTGDPVVIPDPHPEYSTTKKIQYYLKGMKSEIGNIDGDLGVNSAHALIIAQAYSNEFFNDNTEYLTGKNDDNSLSAIKRLAESGTDYSIIKEILLIVGYLRYLLLRKLMLLMEN